jgi:hypothetical protein
VPLARPVFDDDLKAADGRLERKRFLTDLGGSVERRLVIGFDHREVHDEVVVDPAIGRVQRPPIRDLVRQRRKGQLIGRDQPDPVCPAFDAVEANGERKGICRQPREDSPNWRRKGVSGNEWEQDGDVRRHAAGGHGVGRRSHRGQAPGQSYRDNDGRPATHRRRVAHGKLARNPVTALLATVAPPNLELTVA